MKNKYPIYIISKGRWESRLTSKALEKMNCPYRIVIEPQEFDEYSNVIDPKKIIVLPFSNLGKGSIPARNFVWKHSLEEGHERHWIMDDNMRGFHRWNKNRKLKVFSPMIFKAMEDFTDRYTNIAFSGPQYFMFVRQKWKDVPFRINTRIYSCILVNNSLKYRWRGKYNEDTDLCLRALKGGWCTILFNAFLVEKTTTMVMKGGNTDELYKQDSNFDGRLEMARSLQRQHPDVTKVVRKWGRWQHSVNYSQFKKNKLIKKEGVKIEKGIDNYNMELKKK